MVWATNLSNICSMNLPKVGIYWTITSDSCPRGVVVFCSIFLVQSRSNEYPDRIE